MKTKLQISIGLLSLLCLLAYTWTHTGGLLAEYVNPWPIGYVAALGIELSIVGLSLRIGDLKRSGLNTRFFAITLFAVVVVSALANIAQGYAVKFGEPLTLAGIGHLDLVQAVVSLSATGLISLVTFALAELVGQDVNAAAKVSGRIVRPAAAPTSMVTVARSSEVSNTEGVTPFPMPIEQARAVKSDTDAQQKAVALDTLVAYLSTHPDATVSELARVIGKSRPTVYNYLEELETAGKLHRNGQLTVLDSVPG